MQRNSYCTTQASLVGAVQQDCVTDDELSILDRESITVHQFDSWFVHATILEVGRSKGTVGGDNAAVRSGTDLMSEHSDRYLWYRVMTALLRST
jgi:hypothetical protein